MARTLDEKAQKSYRELGDQQDCTLYADDPDVYPVDEILAIRAVSTEIEYLVRWTGYSAEYDQWVAERNVTSDLKRAFSQAIREKRMKSLKRRENLKIERSVASTIKKEHEDRKASPSKFTLQTAVKKEENVTPKSATFETVLGL